MEISNKLKEYLKKLEYNFMYINSLVSQVNKYHKWIEKDEINTIDIGSFFYKLTMYTYKRIVTIELYKILSENEERSLFHWLEQIDMHTNSILSKNNNDIKSYRNIIKKNTNELNNFSKE